MLDGILEWDKELLIVLNSFHAPWLDPLMLYASKTITWLPLFLFLLYQLVKHYKKDIWLPLSGVALAIVLADQITSSFMKPFFARLRPSQEPLLKGVIHLVDGYTGGLYGFASSHAANTFGVAMFFWLLNRSTSKWYAALFLWAALMSYTRIYLGVHYPGDVAVGALVGLLAGWIGYRLASQMDGKLKSARLGL